MAVLCSLLLMNLSSVQPAVAAAPALGQVTVNGQATINGIVMLTGATLFGGDRVATGENAVADLTLNGGNRVLLPGTSVVVLTNQAAQMMIDLRQGGLALASQSSLPAFIDANGARIKPAPGSTILEVAVRANSLKVLVHRGSAAVETADRTLNVEEGKELDATMVPDPSQGPAGARPAGRSGLEKWVFIGAVAAGLTGLILGIIAISRPSPASCIVVSPSGPGSIKCP
jgi:ferric-dicitrate binding protein FerR (iron transport regulator)